MVFMDFHALYKLMECTLTCYNNSQMDIVLINCVGMSLVLMDKFYVTFNTEPNTVTLYVIVESISKV
jgi:hypothetical protein